MLEFLNRNGVVKPEADSRPLISLHQVVKRYKTAAGDFTALKGIDLTVGAGEFVGVVGKSGSGKSTLINMITGIDRPTSGEVFIGGVPIHTFNEGQMARWRGRSMGIVFQFFQLLPMLSVAENIMLPMDFCSLYNPRKRRERALQLLDLVGVATQADKLPTMLSGGEQQRVAIARALANDPPIIAADEPTGNLDSKTSKVVFQLFEELVARGKTVLMVTHDGELANRVKRLVVIADGEIIEGQLAKAFPSLTQQQLAWATSKISIEERQAGSVVIERGETPQNLYVVTEGKVEVVVETSAGQESVVSRLGSGQFFGAAGMLDGSPSMATVRAAPGGKVRIARLDRSTFAGLLSESEATRQQIVKVARTWLQNGPDMPGEAAYA